MNDRIQELAVEAGADIHAGDGGYQEGTQEKHDEFAKIRNQSLAEMRVRELAREAGFYANPDIEKFEKFAELIVKECLDQCYNRGMNDAFYAGQLQAAAYIEQYFGVEV